MKSTKKAFVFSLLSVLLCVSMLIGTTFAWFTDTATSSNNRIVAGNLDVDLVMYNGTEYVSIAGGSGDIFDTAAIAQNKPASLWEPGKTQIVYLGVQNKGNLAIKYNIILDVTDTDATDGVNLADVLDYAIIDGKTYETTYANWAAVTNATSTTGVIGTQMGNSNPARITAAQNGTLDEIRNGTQNETNYFVLAVHMQETAGNEYQGKEIVIDLSVVATQKDAEEDSFNNQYDAGLDTPTAPTAIHDIATATFEEPAEITTVTTGATPVSTATVAATTIQTTDATSTIAAPTTVTLSDYTAPTATDTTDKVTGLTRTIDTTASSETGVTYNIGYKATVTTTTNNVVVGTEEYAVHTFGSIVENVVNVGAGLTNVKVTHGGSPMNPADNTTAKADGTYYYDSATGDLYIWSSTYSAYTISWDIPEYVASVGSNNYTTLGAAFAAAKNGDTVTLLKNITVSTNDLISFTDYWNATKNAVVPFIHEGITFEGNNKTIKISGDGMYLFGDVRNATIQNFTVDYDNVVNGSIIYYSQYATLNNVVVTGEDTFTSGNAAAFVIYPRYDLTMTDCVNKANLYSSTGDETMYDAVFIGYTLGTGTIEMTRCNNEGKLVCGKAGMFVSNWSYSTNSTFIINDCKNNGLIQSTTSVYYNGAGAYNYCTSDYWDKAGCLTFQFDGGETYTASTTTKWYDTAAQQSVIGTGSFVAGPSDETLAIDLNANGTFTITPASVSGVASYVVSVGTYTTTEIGSHRTYATETFTGTSTTLKYLSFVDKAWVEANESAVAGELAGNVIYTLDDVSYYYVQSPETENVNGTPRAPQMVSVSALDSDGNLLASAGLVISD